MTLLKNQKNQPGQNGEERDSKGSTVNRCCSRVSKETKKGSQTLPPEREGTKRDDKETTKASRLAQAKKKIDWRAQYTDRLRAGSGEEFCVTKPGTEKKKKYHCQKWGETGA